MKFNAEFIDTVVLLLNFKQEWELENQICISFHAVVICLSSQDIIIILLI